MLLKGELTLFFLKKKNPPFFGFLREMREKLARPNLLIWDVDFGKKLTVRMYYRWDPATGLGTPNYPKMLDLFMDLP